MAPLTLALDTSVVVAAALPHEDEHRAASALLRLLDGDNRIIVPSLLIPEFTGALRRNGRPPVRIREYLTVFRGSSTQIWPVDIGLADEAAEIALLQSIKGSDSVFLALARFLGIPLITLDREQRERAPVDVEVFTPEQALAKWWPGQTA